MGKGMFHGSIGCGSKPSTPAEHQNLWAMDANRCSSMEMVFIGLGVLVHGQLSGRGRHHACFYLRNCTGIFGGTQSDIRWFNPFIDIGS